MYRDYLKALIYCSFIPLPLHPIGMGADYVDPGFTDQMLEIMSETDETTATNMSHRHHDETAAQPEGGEGATIEEIVTTDEFEAAQASTKLASDHHERIQRWLATIAEEEDYSNLSAEELRKALLGQIRHESDDTLAHHKAVIFREAKRRFKEQAAINNIYYEQLSEALCKSLNQPPLASKVETKPNPKPVIQPVQQESSEPLISGQDALLYAGSVVMGVFLPFARLVVKEFMKKGGA